MFNIYLKDAEFKEPDDQIYYLLAANGLFLIKKTRFFTSSHLAFTPAGKANLAWLDQHKESIRVHLPKKLSSKILTELISFFRVVYKQYDGAEAIGIIYWDENLDDYTLVIPNQEVGRATLPYYQVGPNPEGMTRIGTIHSHGSIKAFHSGVDHEDEVNDEGFHLTIGNLDLIPTFSCSVVCDEKRTELDLRDVVEIEIGDFPGEWLEKVKKIKKLKSLSGGSPWSMLRDKYGGFEKEK